VTSAEEVLLLLLEGLLDEVAKAKLSEGGEEVGLLIGDQSLVKEGSIDVLADRLRRWYPFS
jgi:hypothetical protein